MTSIRQSCEEINLSFLGEIQNLGFLILADQSLNIISFSDNYLAYLGSAWNNSLHKNLLKELHHHKIISNSQVTGLRKLIEEQELLESLELSIHGKPFHLSIHEYQDIFYFEFEFKVAEPVMSMHRINSKILGIQQVKTNVWQLLCGYIQDVIAMDRVMIYQFNEDQSGVVIAESLTDTSLESFLGYHYPEFDIPIQARTFYLKKHCRFVTDIDLPSIKISGISPAVINLSSINIRSLAPIHLEYLKNAGFKSSISFSIIINNVLWGLVCCQSIQAKHIDLANRNLALALTYSAAAKFQEQRNIKLLLFKEKVQEFELLLKEKLLLKQDPIGELNNLANDLMWFMRSDGLALIHQNKIHLHGETPAEEDIQQLMTVLIHAREGQTLVTSPNIQSLIPEVPASYRNFPGIATFIVGENRDLSIVWFRKELIFKRKWAGNPTKLYSHRVGSTQSSISPRKSFELWVEDVQGKAIPWNERQTYFLTRIKHIVLNALIQKSQEIESLNKKLIERNNALDTYAYTVSHDLKNPLTAIKLSAQFIQQRPLTDKDTLVKFTERITHSVDQMCSMLDRIHDLASANSITFQKEKLELKDMIEDIIYQCKAQYGRAETQIETKNILPIYGEKTLIYQLFLNLIGNAIKYSSKKEVPHVLIHAKEEDDSVAYYITDNGIGMEASDLSSIFEIFKRMDNAQQFEGSGIGMSIVKRIIDKLNIQIHIQSEINRGTCIRLNFSNP
ncbi:sensor histidine kinase [Sphingobacterium sp. HJSM2_6]|uniref:sensor histidine kinase n=1 Tax=Sphingobacterium sp. HJSM2_6 TaxID=3366264 RepID=UPI003BDB53BE